MHSNMENGRGCNNVNQHRREFVDEPGNADWLEQRNERHQGSIKIEHRPGRTDLDNRDHDRDNKMAAVIMAVPLKATKRQRRL